MSIIGMKIPARGKIFHEGGITTMKQAMDYVLTLPVSSVIVGITNVKELEENMQMASEFKPLTERRCSSSRSSRSRTSPTQRSSKNPGKRTPLSLRGLTMFVPKAFLRVSPKQYLLCRSCATECFVALVNPAHPPYIVTSEISRETPSRQERPTMRFLLSLFLLLLVSLPQTLSQTLTIRVHAPADTPDTATIYVAGNLPALGSWRADGLRLVKGDSAVWSAGIIAPKGTEVEFKITLGSWEQEALYAVDAVPGNVRVVLHADTTVTLSPVTWKHLALHTEGITGTVRYHRGVKPKNLTYTRRITVWLPPSYDSALSHRYPVLYMQDGQNIIDPPDVICRN